MPSKQSSLPRACWSQSPRSVKFADSAAAPSSGSAAPPKSSSSGPAVFKPPAEAPAPAPAPSPVASKFQDPRELKLSYEQLKAGLPGGVDPAKKEQYLSDADFEKIMKSPRSEFNEMKPWKQAQLKKAAGLY